MSHLIYFQLKDHEVYPCVLRVSWFWSSVHHESGLHGVRQGWHFIVLQEDIPRPQCHLLKGLFFSIALFSPLCPASVGHTYGFICQHASKFGKLSSGHRTGKGQFSFQSQRKTMPRNVSNYRTVALISHASKVMLKILQARLQQYVNCELADIQSGFRQGRGTRDQIANICWIIKKAPEFQKNIYFCFIDYAKAFNCVDQNKLWKILKEIGIPDHLACLLRKLYAGQDATVRT